MVLVAGADGCRAGWICVRRDLETGTISAEVYKTAHALIYQEPPPATLAIDIPIGLPERGARCCDRLARQQLGLRRNSVFPAPLRSVLRAATWEEAAQISQRVCQKGISKQARGICSKVRDVDLLMNADPRLQQRVREVHPEVCFWAWNGNRPMPFAKKTAEGFADRRALVRRGFGSAFDAVRKQRLAKDVCRDDILDAFAALWTAVRIFQGRALSFPAEELCDARGLRMEIVY